MHQNNRREEEAPKEYSESIFLLKKNNTQSTVTIQADFSPLVNTHQQPTGSQRTLPIFNTDGLHFTPSFILPLDQQRYIESRDLYSRVHDRKVAEISEQKAELFVPRPSKNNSFCCICRTPFEDYLAHVSTPKHKILLLKSDYNLKIMQLCQGFKIEPIVEKKRRGRPPKTPKTKLIRKESQSTATRCGSIESRTPEVSQFSIQQ